MERIKNKHGEKNSISIRFFVCAVWIGLLSFNFPDAADFGRYIRILCAHARVTSKYFISREKRTQRK